MSNSEDFSSALQAIDDAARTLVNVEKAQAVISQARIDLVMGRDAKAVFFATIAMRLRMEPDASIETAATDGKRIVYSPTFVAGLSRAEALGLLAHEVLHVTNAHHARMGDRDPQLWNIACDLAINPLLREAGLTLPDGGLFPGEGRFAKLKVGESAEAYYAELQKSGHKPNAGSDPGGSGGVMKPGKGSDAECRQAEAEAKEMAASAEQAVKASGRGELPGGIGRGVREMLEPKADWKAILREFVARQARNDFSWSRPNRRFIHSGLYLPGLHSEELGDVVAMFDTSGSTQPHLTEFASELEGILGSYDCKLTILYHNTRVYRVQEWRSTDGPLKMEDTEDGGTSHVDAFDYIEREAMTPACVVALTDLYTDFPKYTPDYPTLWVKTGAGAKDAPFGRVVDLA